MRVKEGDIVRKGDELIIIDQRQLKAEVDRAESGLAEARKAVAAAISARDAAIAEENLALSTFERFKQLKEQNLISVQQFEEVEAQYLRAKAASKQAEAMVDAAGARVKSAEALVSSVSVSKKDAVITAPHDGIITAKLSDKGDLATPGTPLLVLETARGFCVDVLLPETYIEYIQPKQEVLVTVPALKTDPLNGIVCTIVPSADPRSRSFTVKINLPVDMKVNSGLFARAKIPIGSSKKILIPVQAVIYRGQLTGIYIIDKENIAHFRLIRTGKMFGESVEVLSGLITGDRYVNNPRPELSDGAKVEVSS
jgi:RND family efflux transporter MFP subunit